MSFVVALAKHYSNAQQQQQSELQQQLQQAEL